MLDTLPLTPTLLEARFGPPLLRPHLVQRDDVLELVRSTGASIVAVCAPAGYGKTTFLAQLAATASHPVAWVSLDEADNDPVQLLMELATVLDRCAPLDPRVFNSLLSPEPPLFTDTLPATINSLTRSSECLLILDGIENVTAQRSLDVLEYLCDFLPANMRLVLAGRQLQSLPIARLRTRGVLLELGPRELSLTRAQARALLADAGVHVASDALHALYAQTEGWPAGVYLATLAVRAAGDPDRVLRDFDGADPHVVEFLLAEHLASMSDDHVAFLQATSVFERFSTPLCDAALGRDDSAAVLTAMEQSSGFIIALDRRRQWYRYHHLFRQALQAELARHEPGRLREIHTRASRWYAAQGEYARAIEHAVSARDERRVAELLSDHVQAAFDSVPQTTLCRWLQLVSDAVLTEYPRLAVAAAWLTFQLGDLEKSRRCMRLLDGLVFDGECPLGEANGQSAVALLKAAFGWDGVSQIGKWAQVTRRLEPPVSRAYRIAGLCLGASLLLRDRRPEARDLLEDVAEITPSAVDVGAIATALLALLDLEERDADQAETHISQTFARLDSVGLNEGLASAALIAARAWLELLLNDRAASRVSLELASSRLQRTQVVPWLNIYLHVVLGRVALELDDCASAGSLLAAARRGLARYPDAGTLPHLLAGAERAQEAAEGGGRQLLEPLTQAELRVLELAPTCLNIESIARTLSVSKNTVKTHLKAIYAKLAVASRNEAVDRGRELRLIS